MKRKLLRIIKWSALTMILFAMGCQNVENNQSATTDTVAEAVTEEITEVETVVLQEETTAEVDLTTLSSTMVYAEVYNMMSYPDQYIGKTIKMEGEFAVVEGENRNYYACIIADATSCCAQGIEFVLAEELVYPDEYPAVGSTVCVSGIFDVYAEDNVNYCQLIDASWG